MTSKEWSVFEMQDEMKHQSIDMIVCSICTEVFKDPRILPCYHTFCMDCIENASSKSSNKPEDKMPCPMCRHEFTLPSEGVVALPKNMFIHRLVEVSTISNLTPGPCDLCTEEAHENGVSKTVESAELFCEDCCQRLCCECCTLHRRFKLTKNHRLMKIGEQKLNQSLLTENLARCEVHEQNILDIVCSECKTVVCALCFIENHSNHKGSYIDRVADDFRKQLQDRVDSLVECGSKSREKRTGLDDIQETLLFTVKQIESSIRTRTDELQELVERHRSRLAQELDSLKRRWMKEIQSGADDIDMHLTCIESYRSYCRQILEKGSSVDIYRDMDDLIASGNQLQQQNRLIFDRELPAFKVTFSTSNLEDLLRERFPNIVGEIAGSLDINFRKRNTNLTEEETENLHKMMDNVDITTEPPQETIKKHREVKTCTQQLLSEESCTKALQADKGRLQKQLTKESNGDMTSLAYNDDFKELDAFTMQPCSERSKKELDRSGIGAEILQTDEGPDSERTTIESLKEEKENSTEFGSESPSKTLLSRFFNKKKEPHGYKSDPALIKKIRTKSPAIFGLTVLDNEIFIISRYSSEVEVYESTRLSFSRRFDLKGLIYPQDMASCKRNKCIYIVDWKLLGHDKEIVRVDPNGNLISRWPTGAHHGQVSVTHESNVLMAVYVTHKLIEYSPDGQVLNEIELKAELGIRHPLHAVKLTGSRFVVSCGDVEDELHRICLLDSHGNVEKSFGGKKGNTDEQLNVPICLAVSEDGCIFVADLNNSRILLLDSDLEFVSEICSVEKRFLRDPFRVYLDDEGGRLFVVDNSYHYEKKIWRDGRVLIFDIKI